jgi:hypothetical protein
MDQSSKLTTPVSLANPLTPCGQFGHLAQEASKSARLDLQWCWGQFRRLEGSLIEIFYVI